MTYQASSKRINAAGNAVFEITRAGSGMYQYHVATVEVNSNAPSGLKVLLGALQPRGKELAWDAIRAYEMPGK